MVWHFNTGILKRSFSNYLGGSSDSYYGLEQLDKNYYVKAEKVQIFDDNNIKWK